jgi:hypothetical protein
MENSKKKKNEQNVDHSDKTNKQITKFSVSTKTKQSHKKKWYTNTSTKTDIGIEKRFQNPIILIPRKQKEERVG